MDMYSEGINVHGIADSELFSNALCTCLGKHIGQTVALLYFTFGAKIESTWFDVHQWFRTLRIEQNLQALEQRRAA
jgi:hypothetical protein